MYFHHHTPDIRIYQINKARFIEFLPYILFSLVYYTTPQPSKSRKE
nr:MAG TPA: proteasome alpha-type subunit 1 [Caudoviricetes sp.]